MTILTDFCGRERALYAPEETNLFLAAVREVDRYLQYMEIALARHAQLSAQFAAITKRFFEAPKGVSAVTPQMQATIDALGALQTLIAMDHETFCLFGTIFLDRAACFVERYFGHPTSGRIDSHRKLDRKLTSYAVEKGLLLPDGLADSVRWLEERVCEYRDHEIAHDKSMRWTYGMKMDPDGTVLPVKSGLFLPPRPVGAGRPPIEAIPLQELKERINRYVSELIALIETNRAHTCYKLKASAAVTG